MASSNEPTVVSEAIELFAKYDTPETLRFLLALLKHDDEGIVGSAMQGLAYSKRPEAKAALVEKLDSHITWHRWHACILLGSWLGRGDAEDLVPAIARMLGDKDEQVRWRAALALREARTPHAALAFQKALETKDTKQVEDGLLSSIHVIYVLGNKAAKAQIEKRLDVIVNLMARRFDLTSECATLIIDTCESPASEAFWKDVLKNHADEQVRRYVEQAFEIRRLMKVE